MHLGTLLLFLALPASADTPDPPEEAAAPEEAEEAAAPEEAEEAAAPEEAEAAEEDDEDDEDEVAVGVAEAAPRSPPPDEWGLGVGLHLGPAFSLSRLRTAASPRMEVFVEPPGTRESLRGVFAIAHLRPTALGDLQDPDIGDGTTNWRLRQSEWLFSVGATWRFHDLVDLPVIPEATLAPTLFVLRSRVNGESGGHEFGEAREAYGRLGLMGSIGAAAEVDVLEFTFHLHFAGSALGGTITGPSHTFAITPMVGARVLLL